MEFLKKTWIYIIAIIIAVTLIGVDYVSRKSASENFDIEEYAKTLVEDSQIKVNDKLYYGTYGTEEITELPEGYELIGEIKERINDRELTDNFTSNSVGVGYEVYANKNDDTKILLRVTEDTDQYQSYIEYNLKLDDDIVEIEVAE